MRVAICGAGRTGHLNAVLFKQNPQVHLSVLTENDTLADNWAGNPAAWQAFLPDGQGMSGRPDYVGNNPDEAVGDADLIVITQPAHARSAVLQRIAGSISSTKQVFVGAIPGFCGFDWLAADHLGARDNVVIWGLKDVPHIAYDLVAGQSVRMGGAKAHLFAGLHRRESAQSAKALQTMLTALYNAPVTLLQDYLEITLTPGNALMHPAMLYGLLGPGAAWERKPFSEPLCWWSDCPEEGAHLLEMFDAENQAICQAIATRTGLDLSSVKPLRQELIEAYGDQIADSQTMYSLLRTNSAYAGIQLPLIPNHHGQGWLIDLESRAFHEDVACGQALLVKIAERLAVPIPAISKTYTWARHYHGALPDGLSPVPDDWLEAA
ncbi:NAD/NADP octopine/nopaline dehydrogenase family protein [Agrobacterium vitis]|uniref:NAD/NADP octopine/nopaline dehydrogenase family protein n=1 Tax=Agrobacterium vitis TaxID=373 RepID=UPI003D2B3748